MEHKNFNKPSGVSLRTGVTALETAITLPVLLLMIFALLDLGLAAIRYNALSEVSRRIARDAIWHGSLAPSVTSSWGPEEFVGTVGDDSAIVMGARGMILTMNGSDVKVRVTWLDNDNSPRDRVQVNVAFEHRPLIPGICPWGTLDLRSSTTMYIVN